MSKLPEWFTGKMLDDAGVERAVRSEMTEPIASRLPFVRHYNDADNEGAWRIIESLIRTLDAARREARRAALEWVAVDGRPVPPGPWYRATRIVADEDEHAVYLRNDANDSLILDADDVAGLANAILDANIEAVERGEAQIAAGRAGPIPDWTASRSDDPREVRRLAVEALIAAHYDTSGLDAAAELRWLGEHDAEADALMHALMLKGDRLYRDALDPTPYLPDGTPNPAWPPSYRAIAEKARRGAARCRRLAALSKQGQSE